MTLDDKKCELCEKNIVACVCAYMDRDTIDSFGSEKLLLKSKLLKASTRIEELEK